VSDNRPQLIAPESVAHDVIADLDYFLRRAQQELGEGPARIPRAKNYIKLARKECDRLLIRTKTNDPETAEFLKEFSTELENSDEL